MKPTWDLGTAIAGDTRFPAPPPRAWTAQPMMPKIVAMEMTRLATSNFWTGTTETWHPSCSQLAAGRKESARPLLLDGRNSHQERACYTAAPAESISDGPQCTGSLCGLLVQGHRHAESTSGRYECLPPGSQVGQRFTWGLFEAQSAKVNEGSNHTQSTAYIIGEIAAEKIVAENGLNQVRAVGPMECQQSVAVS